jgi:hypothetical protein
VANKEIRDLKERVAKLEGKETPASKSLIHIVLDRSGSMEQIWSDVKGGFDKFIKDQAQYNPDVTLTYFDDEFGTAFVNEPIKRVKKLESYKEIGPRGSTALLDAVGKGIKTVEGVAKKYDKIVFMIYTDGLENASKEYTNAQITSMVRKHRDNWAFVYLGANQDAWKVGTSMGFYGGSTQTFVASAAGVARSYGVTGQSVSDYLGGQSGTVTFEDDEATPEPEPVNTP